MSPVSRRSVLAGAASTSASLLIPVAVRPARAQPGVAAQYEITDWITIAPDGEVTLGLSQPEVGQGSYTALPQILADELDADWARVKVRFVTGRPAYKIAFRQEPPAQNEGASMSTTALYTRLRTAGAAARDALIRAAAQRWRIDVSQCRTESGMVINARGEALSYGELAAEAARLPLNRIATAQGCRPLPPHRQAGRPSRHAGQVQRQRNLRIDVAVPGMLNAAIKTARSFSGQVTSIKNEADILKMPGVHAVVKIAALAIANEDAGAQHPQIPHSAAAQRGLRRGRSVLAGQARGRRPRRGVRRRRRGRSLHGRNRRQAQRRPGCRAGRYRADQRAAEGNPQGARNVGDRATLPAAAHRARAIGAGQRDRQLQGRCGRGVGADPSGDGVPGGGRTAAGCSPDDVEDHVTFLGGSFGRKIVPDYVLQAVQASKAVGRPVKLTRSREEDMQHDVYRPNAGGRFRAVLDDAGYPLAVQARIAGQSLFGAVRKSWLDQTPEGAWDESMVDGIYNQSYRLPHFLVETVDTPLPIPVYFMRSVGSTAAVFFWESFITELAHRAGIDQHRYRRNLLTDDPLAVRVLDAAAEAAGWGKPAPPDTFRGIAYNCYIGRGGRFKTYVAEVAELQRVADHLAIKRVFCAVDPGLVVNPNTLRAQIEGGIGFALTNTLKSKITFSNGGADQSNFFDYPLLSIDEMPEIIPIVLDSDRPPQGFGEVVLAPVAPAVAQALLHATGRHLDTMPFPQEVFR